MDSGRIKFYAGWIHLYTDPYPYHIYAYKKIKNVKKKRNQKILLNLLGIFLILFILILYIFNGLFTIPYLENVH